MRSTDITKNTNPIIVGRTNGLERFLTLARGYEPLTASEEFNLMSEYYSTKDEHRKNEIEERIVMSNLKMIYSFAKQYSKSPEMIMDLVGEGVIGMVTAFNGYDITKGMRFTTYASHWIRKKMSEHVYDSATVKRCTDMKYIAKANKERERFLSENERAADDEEIKNILNEKYDLGIKNKESISPISMMFIDSSVADSRDGDKLKVEDSKDFNEETCSVNGYVEEMNREDLKARVSTILSILTERDRDIVCMMLGIGYPDEINPEDIAEKYDMGVTRVRQIYKSAIEKLRKYKYLIAV